MSSIDMLQDEVSSGTWTLNYIPPNGGRYLGKLTVTNQRILFDATFDVSAQGVLGELFITSGSHGFLSIPKDQIQNVAVKSGFFKKKVTVTLGDGQAHVFDYGMLSVKKIAAAIEG